MKILMLTPYLPYPPASGGQIRTLNLLKYLSKHHQITLIALYKHEQDKKYISQLESYCHRVFLCKRAENPWQFKNVLKSIFTLLPFLIVRNFSVEAKETVERLLKEESFDVIHAETFYITPHLPQTTTPLLLVEQTIEYKVYQHYINSIPIVIRTLLHVDIIKLRYWEQYFWKKASLVATVSEQDKKEITKLQSVIEPVVIPNGAGDEMFVENLPKKNLNKPSLLFVGNFFWLQNVEAANYIITELLPIIKKQFNNIELIIAGQNASNKINKTENKGLKIIDLQQDDTQTVKNLYHNATLFIAPIWGPGGTRLKILAAMAAGLPVVSTKTGIEGLEVSEGKDVLVAETAEEFAIEIHSILLNEQKYKALQGNAFKIAKEKYSWEAIAKKLEKVYRKITK